MIKHGALNPVWGGSDRKPRHIDVWLCIWASTYLQLGLYQGYQIRVRLYIKPKYISLWSQSDGYDAMPKAISAR